MKSDARVLNKEFVEGALQAESDSSDVFFNEVPVLLAQISRDLHYVQANNAYANFFGLSQADIIGHHVIEILGAEAFEQAHDHLQAALNGEHPHYLLAAPHRSGQNRWLDVRYLPKENGDSIDGIYVMVADVHELYESREVVEQRNKELSLLNDSLLEFSYRLSHDLKAPLTTIQGLVDLSRSDLKEGELDVVDENLGKVANLAETLAKRVKDVLQVARLNTNADEIELLHIPALVDKVSQTLNLENHVNVTKQFEHTCQIRSVAQRVESILENLLSNAVKFKNPEASQAWVKLKTWEDSTSLFLSVEDNGIGIPAAYQHKVFQLFSRMPNHTAEGSGIGLAFARQNAIQLGGNIEFQSGGEGTIFTLQLPKS